MASPGQAWAPSSDWPLSPVREEEEAASKLRILCLHAAGETGPRFQKQLEGFFLADQEFRSWLELSFLEGCVELSVDEARPVDRAAALALGAEPKVWFREPAGGAADHVGVQDAVSFATAHVARTGPWDGLCGSGQGGDVAAVLTKLAEEGHPQLAGQFRFLLLFNAALPKGPEWRPKAPLQTPACLVFATGGSSSSRCAVPMHEQVALHWDLDAREVITHEHQGFTVPSLDAEDFARIRRFVEGFRDGWRGHSGSSRSSRGGDKRGRWGLGDHVLPVPRLRDGHVELPQGRILAVCFHDAPHCEEGPAAFARLTARAPRELMGRVALDAPLLRRYASLEGFSQPTPAAALSEHEVQMARQIVEGFFQSDLGGRPTIIIGLGFGAYVSFLFAEALRAAGGHPWRLFLVRPAAIFPAPDAGSLGECAVSCLLPESDVAGSRWRFAVATHGAFEVRPHAGEGEKWVDVVIDSLRATLDDLSLAHPPSPTRSPTRHLQQPRHHLPGTAPVAG